jgi:3-dehydroquinate synthetase
VAASFMRGVSYVQVPTTLLAQVDSSVGGKVAIDLPEGKNLAGAFYPPAQVLVGGHFLRTLPDRQLRNGLAEVLKYGFIADPQILASTAQGLLENLDAVVDNCIQIKARIVEEDEFETNGIRAALNFGHTIGHALEAELHYEGLLHGEAVAIGMMVEARLGEMIGFTRSGIAQSVAEHLLKAELPTTHPALKKVDSLLDSMRRDKKARNGKLTFSLIPEIGSCKLVTGVREEDVRAALLA